MLDLNVLARQLSNLAEESDFVGWFWIDGGSFGEPQRSYLGLATSAVECVPGQENQFVATLNDQFAHHAQNQAQNALSGSEVFSGGWVLALSYEFGVNRMGLDQSGIRNGDSVANAFALRAPVVIEHNATTGETSLVPTLSGETEHELLRVLQRTLDTAQGETAAETQTPTATKRTLNTVWRFTGDEYENSVRECQRHIDKREADVLCLTNQATVQLSQRPDPLAIYQKLRDSSDAPRSGVIVYRDRALISASPERLVRLEGSSVSSAPIKGTRPRGKTQVEDIALAQELAHDPKERAENTMILDLLRDDLSKVCTPESIRVNVYCQVETYRQVHQLVSSIEGKLDADRAIGFWQVIDSVFPGGSMTGVPKRRAMKILHAVEGVDRGLYSGCFGWVSVDGKAAELAMTIRSVELRGKTAIIGAGGGITSDSVPSAEVAEMQLKARAVLDALDAFIEH